MFIVSGEDLAGSNPKAWRAEFKFATKNTSGGCLNATNLVDLKAKLQRGLGENAMGIAVGPTNYSITKRFSKSACANDYDSGYHQVTLMLTACDSFPNPNSQKEVIAVLTAVKSTLSQVSFLNAVPAVFNTPIEGMRYSPMGGLIVQIVAAKGTGFDPFPTPTELIYRFYTRLCTRAGGRTARWTRHDDSYYLQR